MYLQHPIDKDTQCLSYSRYSTEEQRAQSIDDQHQFNIGFLEEQGIDASLVERIEDEGISGENRSRPGINRVLAGIAACLWQLIIVEDSSRLFRGVSPCVDLVGRAVDAGIRVICIGDHVDTANDDWQGRLEDAQRHHGHDNYKTRYRIKRAMDGLWRTGAAIGLLNPGYNRYQRNPEIPKSPKFDRVDEQWVTVVKRAYEMVATKHSTRDVAKYLTQEKLPKTGNSLRSEWTPKNVISLIRNPIYRGEERYRDTVAKKIHSTGKTKCIKNPNPDKIEWRPMPHLRMVEDLLWNQANQVLDEMSNAKPGSGRESLLYGIPRDSRGPLSTIFECGRSIFLDQNLQSVDRDLCKGNDSAKEGLIKMVIRYDSLFSLRTSANSVLSCDASTGLTRWLLKPASLVCSRSLSWPQPVRAKMLMFWPQGWVRI